jgi:hypothetical protein
MSMAYNYIRYATVLPKVYLNLARELVPPLHMSALFLFGTVFSPKGGIISFWLLPLLSAVVILRWFGLRSDCCAMLSASVAAALSAIAFSMWWSPFGWGAWGDRLMVPSMLSLLIVIVLTASPTKKTAMSLKQKMAMILLCPLVLYSAYYVALPYISKKTSNQLVSSTMSGPACQAMRKVREKMGRAVYKTDYYYRCTMEGLFQFPKP